MVTCRMQSQHRSFYSVSNPLGWDGDGIKCDNGIDISLVSNPLGWDGDFPKPLKRKHAGKVSNPLGWDGDPCQLPFFASDMHDNVETRNYNNSLNNIALPLIKLKISDCQRTRILSGLSNSCLSVSYRAKYYLLMSYIKISPELDDV